MWTLTEEYRAKATEYEKRAHAADDPLRRAQLLNVAEQWKSLAAQAATRQARSGDSSD